MNVEKESDIPIENLYSHPVVQELLSKIDNNLEDIKIPYIIEGKTLMSPGVWNGYFYSSDSIKDAFLKSEWDKKEIRSLFLDHEDLRTSEWIGEVVNPRMKGDDVVGDLVVVDKSTAMKLAYGAKMGISPKVSGGENNGKMNNFKFDNFSVVINPAVKTAYINNSEQKLKKANKEVNKMAEEEDKKPEAPQEEAPKEEAKEEQPKAEDSTDSKAEPEEPNEEPQEEEKAVENASDIIDVFSNLKETNEMQISDIAKKAKEIRKKNPDMKWTDAIKEASKSMQDEEEDKEEKKKDNAKKSEDKEKDEMAKKKKYPETEENSKKMNEEPQEEEKEEEAPKEEAKEENKVENEMSETISKQNELIQELSKKLEKVEEKLNEPDKATVKTEEMSQECEVDPDTGFMNTLKNM